jgi:hypothetical protein
MLYQLKNFVRRPGRALAALIALIASFTGCDKNVNWRGVSTDSEERGRAATTNANPGEPPHDQRR